MDPKIQLLKEYENWSSKTKNNKIELTRDSYHEDGRICLEFKLSAAKKFTIICPSDYPAYEDHFFVEACPSLQFWCNELNEFILDSAEHLHLEAILEKAISLLDKRASSPSVSTSESEEGDEFMVVGESDDEEEDWEYILGQKKKRWRMKEAELRALTKQPKTSDMFEGNVKDHPKQVFSNSAASGILTNDLVNIMETKCETGINAEPIHDNIYQWAVYLSLFKGQLNDDLQQLKQIFGYDYIELELNFTMDLYPFYPPVVKVVRPRLQGSMMLRVSSMDMLKLSHWNPARNMKSVLQEIKDYLSIWARLDLNSERNDLQRFPQGAYIQMENYLLWLAWVSEIPSRAHSMFPEYETEAKASNPTDNGKKKSHQKTLFPAGTGYSSSFHKGWDINAYLAAQREKDKQIECVLQKILLEIKKSSRSQTDNFPKCNIPPGLNHTYTSFTVPSSSTDTSKSDLTLTGSETSQTCPHIPPAPKKQCLVCNRNSDITANKVKSPCDRNYQKLHPSSNEAVNGKSPVDPIEDLFNVLEASTLVPFLESKLQVDSFLEICQHTAVYRCVVDIISEVASQPKLVRLLWTLPNQVQSIYTLVTRLEEKAKAVIDHIEKAATNGNGSASAVNKKNNKNTSTFYDKPLLKNPEPPAEEKLARDFYQMSHVIAAALGKEGLLATCDSNGDSPSTSQPSPRSSSSENLDSDQVLAQTYKDALQRLQFLSCDIEVEGASAHHYSKHFKKALPPNSAQVMRIAQEMAALSTSLPLDLGSAIFIRTDDAKCTLLRALIIGPEGTPYSGGCFQFDIYFPPQYPTTPPQVHFCTTGMGQVRFNPNLYSCGTVCLSLLGTWKGLQGEQWLQTSTLLQVLVSIQSLILVPEPYFNEPGYESLLGTETGVRCSQTYSHEVIVNTITHAMIAQLKRPSSGFEDVIQTHFRIKKNRILQEIKNHIKTYKSKVLQGLYESLCVELNKLTTPINKNATATVVKKDGLP